MNNTNKVLLRGFLSDLVAALVKSIAWLAFFYILVLALSGLGLVAGTIAGIWRF